MPIVDFFGEPPADVVSLAKNMELVESALRVRTAQPGGDQTAADGDDEVMSLLIEIFTGVSGGNVLSQLYKIARSEQTVNERLEMLNKIVPFTKISSRKWAKLLGCRRQAIEKTDWWKTNKRQ